MNLFNKIYTSVVKKNNHAEIVSKKKYSTKTLPILLQDPKILLIGGGKVAYQKAKVLKLNNIDFQILSITVNEKIKSLGVNCKIKKFNHSDLENFNIVVNATGSKEVSLTLRKLKQRKQLLINNVDVPEDCDFYFSSLLVYKNLKIAVSSDGASPVITQIVRDRIKKIIPGELGNLVERKLVERENGIVDAKRTKREALSLFGKVFLVGCGPGSADHLTIKALRIIQEADIILCDNLVTGDILRFTKKEAQIFNVGKEKGHYKFCQDEINKIMVQYAKDGFIVARLKGGDPYIFGRGAEEAEFLIDNNIAVEVVPGISSSFAAPLLAGIPPTHRDYSSGVSIVTGHNKDINENFNWLDFLKIKNHTTIVLMSITRAEEILAHGIGKSIDLNLPVAMISNASRENQKVLTSTFGNIIEIANEAEKPAIMVFGQTVNLHNKLYMSTLEKLNCPVEL
ncbi:MAG: uroporphyrinogen-III C-methyltransferase [Ignavibacteriaceae bacterium]